MSSETPWIPVGDLAKGFEHDSYSLSPTNALAGKTLSLSYEDGRVVEHRFTSESALTWTVTEGAEQGRTATEQYRAIEIREGIYFVDLVKNGERATSLSIVLDLCRGICTAVIGRLPDEARARTDLLSRRASSGVDLTPVEAAFLSGAIDAIFTDQTPRHEPTADLVGRRVQYIYSPTEAYEHIYLNQQFYTWHCLRGVEKGLAEPRVPAVMGVMKAMKAQVPRATLEQLGVAAVLPLPVLGYRAAGKRPPVTMIEGEPAAAAPARVRRLREEAKVL